MARIPIVALSILAVAALAGAAHAQTLYRYLDASGRVVYSDKPPPASAKDVQAKTLPENVIQTDPVPFAARQAAERFPITLYTFDCDICKEAQALLVKRGVPFATVIVSEEKGLARLKALTGKQTAPVLQIGDKQWMEGYSEPRWQVMLDDAGYPRTPSLAARQQNARAPSTPAAPPTAPATAPKAQPEAEPNAAVATPGTDYPK